MKQPVILLIVLSISSFCKAQNVGIGKINPVVKLDVLDTTHSGIANFNGGNSMFISFAEKGLYRGYIGSYAGNAEDVDFGTYSGNATGRLHLTTNNNTPRLTILPNGNTGIGTTDPQQQLSISKGLVIDQERGNTGTINSNVLSFGPNSGEAIGARYYSLARVRSLDFYTDSTKRLSIYGDGSLVIDPLGVDSGQQFSPGLYFEDAGTGIRSIRSPLGGDPTGYAMLFMLGGQKRIVFTSGGKVGIKTISPQADLDVNGDLKTRSLQIDDGPIVQKMQHGSYTAGASGSSQLTVTIPFPAVFSSSSLPKVFATARNAVSTNYNDSFSVSVRSVTNTAVVLNIQRTDTNASWAQQLLIDWFAIQ